MAGQYSLCCAKTILWFSVNVSFFVIGIMLWIGSISQLGQVVNYETQEWNKGAITDVIAASTTCGNGYEQVYSKFYGTETICKKIGTSYRVGGCGKKEFGYTQSGLDSSTLSKFDGALICVKRDSSLTYHDLVKLRGASSCAVTSTCGSKTDKEKQFCVPSSKQCPLNNFSVYNKTSTSTIGGTQKAFWKTWNGTYIVNNSASNPISEIYISLSRPCGNRKQDLMKRPTQIKAVYSEKDDCQYDNNGEEHVLYQTVGFEQLEFNVLNDANLIGAIKDKVPDFQDSDLQTNYYKVYQGSYSQWTQQCQALYPTEDIVKIGEVMGEISTYFFVVFIISVVLYGIQLIYWIVFMIFCSCKKPCCFTVLNIKFGILESLSFIALIVIYCITLNGMAKINIDQIRYFSDNKCSDAVLQYAFEKYATDFEHDLAITGLGLAFTILAFLISIMSTVCLTQLRSIFDKICCGKCKILFTGNSKLDDHFENARASIKVKYGDFKRSITKKNLDQAPVEEIEDENGANKELNNIFGPGTEYPMFEDAPPEDHEQVNIGNMNQPYPYPQFAIMNQDQQNQDQTYAPTVMANIHEEKQKDD